MKAYIKSKEEYYLRIDRPDTLSEDKERDVYAVLYDSVEPYLDLSELNPEECIEFYQGEGMTRFRGI